MQNLYDLLGARPDDDAEALKKAFRKAAKASHPDHHGDDPQASARFRQISEAYDILRDAEQRAAYDRLLEFERRPLRHEMKRPLSEMKRHVVQDLMAGALLAVVLAVGYELFVRTPETPAGAASRESVQAAVNVPAERTGAVGRDLTERSPAPQMPIVAPTAPTAAASAASDREQPEKTDEPASNPTGQTIAVATRDSDSEVPTGADVPGKIVPRKTESEPPVRRDAPSFNAPTSAAEDHDSAPAADDRRAGKTPEPAGANTGGVKPPEIKMSAHAPVAAKRHAPSRRPVEQAVLENTNTPAPDQAPSRVFGVGF